MTAGIPKLHKAMLDTAHVVAMSKNKAVTAGAVAAALWEAQTLRTARTGYRMTLHNRAAAG
jgi:DNA-binding SARP family transcriptional activator